MFLPKINVFFCVVKIYCFIAEMIKIYYNNQHNLSLKVSFAIQITLLLRERQIRKNSNKKLQSRFVTLPKQSDSRFKSINYMFGLLCIFIISFDKKTAIFCIRYCNALLKCTKVFTSPCLTISDYQIIIGTSFGRQSRRPGDKTSRCTSRG